ncbi:hypothetical protein EUTSA_v10005952mg [Eutrema salsugineum]|uniref:F-box domain-containing protein n=1 Tax=Eutrema salsugineum TaxID=72664 RepID=V4LKB5_EUTSA|nr:hypothetical protein EUTSA_v10005952mg [Eutrema salsugineum]
MNSKKIDFGSNDLISSLPDALVCHILSFLSTKDAALTSALSKRWRNLLAFVPILDLDNSIYDYPKMGRRKRLQMRTSFKVFVDRVMALQGNATLEKFSLRCRTGRDPSRVNSWILKVLERGVIDLDLYIFKALNYLLPPKVLMVKTLVRLKVEGAGDLTIDVEEFFLPKLKTLHFLDVTFEKSGAAFAKLISGCHLLEELVMVEVSRFDENPNSISFDTPNLYLMYTDAVAVKYPEVKLDSLVEASLRLGKKRRKIENAADFLTGISNVKILYLSFETLKVLNYRCNKIPVFNNLMHLTIETHQDDRWESLLDILENSANLETLTFEGLHYKDTNNCQIEEFSCRDTNKCWDYNGCCICKPWEGTPICISSSPVKMLEDDFEKQTEMIKYFLETMPNLEQVILYYDTPFDVDLKIVSTQFQMLEKVASPKCNIQVISDNISFSTIVHSSSSRRSGGLVFFKNTFPV